MMLAGNGGNGIFTGLFLSKDKHSNWRYSNLRQGTLNVIEPRNRGHADEKSYLKPSTSWSCITYDLKCYAGLFC